MAKIILTESQFNDLTKSLVSEAVGVPEYALETGEELYDLVLNELKNIGEKEENYEFEIEGVDLRIGDSTFNRLTVDIVVNQFEGYDGPAVIASMGVGNRFKFDEGIMMQVNEKNHTVELHINFITPEEWEVEDLYTSFVKEKVRNVSVMAHELMHRYTRHKKPYELMGGTSDYQAYSSAGLNFGIPVIGEFMRYSYFIQLAENLVRPVEMASRMKQQGITKDQFYDFFNSDEVIVELKEIKDFSFEHLYNSLYDQMDNVDGLLEHAGEDPDSMTDEQKIEMVLELVYINLVSAKIEKFDIFFYDAQEKLYQMFGPMAKLLGKGKEPSAEKENVRNNYIKFVMKYQNRELDFFKDECERFNYVSTKLIKRLSKIYSLLSEEKKSILDWDLHQKLMEKKYGKRKIQTEYKFKR
jgi:hypothetical protein